MKEVINWTFARSAARQTTLALVSAAVLLASMLATTAAAAPLPKSSPLYNPGGSPIVNENPEVSAEYRGTMAEVWEYPAIEGHLEHVHRTATLEWAEGVSGPVDQIEYTGVYGASAIHWHLAKLSGSVQEDSTGAGGEPITCSGAFSPTSSDGGEQGVFVPLETPGHPAGGGNPATNRDYTVTPPRGLPSTLLQSSGPAGSICQTSNWNNNGNVGWGGAVAFGNPAQQTEWSDTAGPTVYFPVGGSHTQPLNFSYACEPPACGPEAGGNGAHYGKVSITVSSSITFASPGLSGEGGPVTAKGTPGSGSHGSSPGSPGKSKPTKEDKKAAREDARNQLRPLALECAISTVGVSLLVAGVVAPETGAASVVAAAGPTGAMVLGGAGTACTLLIKRVYDDAKIIDDPPAGPIDVLANPARFSARAAALPSCGPYAASVRGYCERVRKEEANYIASLGRGQSIDAALLATVDRISAAYRAHARGALERQVAHATALRRALSAASSQESSAGRALASTISSAHVKASLTAAQDEHGIAKGASSLAKLGLTSSKLQRLTGVALAPAPVDVLAALRAG